MQARIALVVWPDGSSVSLDMVKHGSLFNCWVLCSVLLMCIFCTAIEASRKHCSMHLLYTLMATCSLLSVPSWCCCLHQNQWSACLQRRVHPVKEISSMCTRLQKHSDSFAPAYLTVTREAGTQVMRPRTMHSSTTGHMLQQC